MERISPTAKRTMLSPITRKAARMYGIVIPAFSGKSTLYKSLQNFKGRGTNYRFVDVDEYTKNTHDSDILKVYSSDEGMKEGELFPKIKDALATMLKNYPKDSVVVITSNVRFIDFLNIKEDSLMPFVPDADLLLQLCDKVATDTPKTLRKADDNNIPSVTATIAQMELKDNKPLPKCPPDRSEEKMRRKQIISTRDSIIIRFGSNAIVYSDINEPSTKVSQALDLTKTLGL